MEKLKALFASSRFKVAVATIICSVALQFFKVDIELTTAVLAVGAIAAWILGETQRPAGGAELSYSARKMLDEQGTEPKAPPDKKDGE